MAAITHFVGNRSPFLTDTIKVDEVPFDLTGSTVRFRMRADDSSALLVDAAATVVSAVAGTVRYDWAAPDVANAGDFQGWWQVTLPSGKTQDTREFDIAMQDHAQQTRALCELEDVTSFAPGYVSDAKTDAVLLQLIRSRSREWHQMTGREFKAIAPAVDPRRFDITDYVAMSRRVRFGDLSSLTSVKLYDLDQSTLVQTITSTDYVALPRVREEWQPITGLAFPIATPNMVTFITGQVLEVSGTWGFPSVPLDVREGCAGMVLFDYLAKVEDRGTLFAASLADVNVGQLYARGRGVMESYALPPLA